MTNVLVYLLFVTAAIHVVSTYEESLRQIHILYRHGDRTPVSFFPRDPYKDQKKFWPQGLGQLTKNGKAMEYALGGWLRDRYGDFIQNKFDTKEAHIVSTDYDRTLMSAQCVLASFYSPDRSIRFNKTIPWMPVPIHSAPAGADMLLNVDASCPMISHALNRMEATKMVTSFVSAHEEMFANISKLTGDKRDTILKNGFLYDTLFIERAHNLTLPVWANTYMDQLREVAAFSFLIASYTAELKRLRAGPVIKQITEHMEKKTKNPEDSMKLFMYSAHDSTVAVLLNSLGAYNHLSPPYASTVLVELHQINSKNVVKVFYRNDTTIDYAYPLSITGCEHACPIHEWRSNLQDVIPLNWAQECNILDPVEEAQNIRILYGVLLLVIVSFLIMTGIIVMKRRRTAGQEYQALSA